VLDNRQPIPDNRADTPQPKTLVRTLFFPVAQRETPDGEGHRDEAQGLGLPDPTGGLPNSLIKSAGVMRFDWVTRASPENLRPMLSLFSSDLAIDLGTVNTRV
jgi:hypothetical protein